MTIPLLGGPEISRRDFLKLASMSLAMFGVYQAITPSFAKKLEAAIGKTAVIWLEGQDCAGCTESFLNSMDPPAAQILLDTISLRYHETAMAASGHQAEEALKESAERFRVTFDRAPVGICQTAEDGRILWINPKLCDIWGYAVEEVDGLGLKDVTHPEDRDAVAGELARMNSGEIDAFSL